jgi:Flp pilus assembly protein TadG
MSRDPRTRARTRTRHRLARRRDGRTAVEAAIVINVVVILLLGVFEYGRLIMMKQLADNAAREGARQAVVNTDPSSGVTTATIQATVTNFLAGQSLSNLVVQVYQADPTTGANIGAWNAAPFGSDIAVQVSFNYVPVFPIYGGLPGTIQLTATSMMRSEAN